MTARLPLSRRLAASTTIAALGASGAAVIAFAAPAQADSGPTPVCTTTACTVTYGYTGQEQTFTVPTGVSSVSVKVYGAQGGGTRGGKGGSTTATMSVTPGDDYTVAVGRTGSVGDVAGSFGGGGNVATGSSSYSGGGGSFVYRLSYLVLAAGGGGGASNGGYVGGAGGGSQGGAGSAITSADQPNYNTTLPTGGTQTGPGTGGKSVYAGMQLGTNAYDGNGPASRPGVYGTGGGGNTYSTQPSAGGGGGGGGYYGGGGGGYYGSGAGGSGFVLNSSALSDTGTASGVQTGNGSVSFSWSKATTTTSLTASPTPGNAKIADPVVLTATVSSGSGTPTGTVAFSSGGATISGCGSQTLDSGVATCSTQFTTANTYSLTAAYSGSNAHQPSTSDALSYKVRNIPSITTTTLGDATFNAAYSTTLATSGGVAPYSFAVTAGTLPAGLSLDAGSGVISGTPSAATSTAASFTVQITDSNNESSSQALTLTVQKAAQQVGFTFSPSSPAVGDRYTIPDTQQGASDQPLVLAGNTNCTISGLAVSFVHAGTCTITADQDGNDNYSAAKEVSEDATVSKAAQTITFTSTAPQTAKVGETYTVTATGGASGTPVTFAGNTYCTTESTQSQTVGEFAATVSFVKAGGTCTITADQEATGDYTPADQQSQQIGVGKGTQAVNFTSDQPKDARVNGTYTVSASGNTKSGADVEVSIDSASSAVCSLAGSSVTFNHPGDCIVDAQQDSTDDYDASPVNTQDISVGKADQTVTITSTAPTPVVGDDYTPAATGDPTSGTAVSFGVLATPSDACTITAGTVSFVHPGSCTVTADEDGSDDYNAGSATQDITVDKAAGSVGVTSDAPTGAQVEGTYTPTLEAGPGSGTPGLEIGSATTNGACTLDGGTVDFVHPGTCAIDATQSGGRDYNDATSKTQSFTVDKGSQTVSFTLDPTDPTVGATYDITSFTKGDGSAKLVFTGNVNCSVLGATVTFVHAGSCAVTASQDADDDYTAADPVEHDVTVAKAAQGLLVTSNPPDNGTVGGSHALVVSGGPSSAPISIGLGDSTTNSACSLGTVTDSVADGVQQAGATISFDRVGTCSVVVQQGGDDDHTSAPTSFVTIVIAGKPTTTTLALSSASVVHGQPITATATVTGTAAGRVVFSVDGRVYDTQPLTGNGTATSRNLADPLQRTGRLRVGAHSVTATFIPSDTDTYAQSSAAGGSPLTVSPASSTTTVAVGPTTLTAAVAVTAPSTDTPTGKVRFAVGGRKVGTAAVVGGVATLGYTVEPGRARTVSATYSGRHDATGQTVVGGSSASTARTDPQITAALTSTVKATTFGWYARPVTVRFTCAAGSAVLTAPCPAPVTIRHDGVDTVTRTVSTQDGGAKTVNVVVRYDHTKPAVSISGPKAGRVYPGALPKAHCVGTDLTSGIASCDITRRVKAGTATYVAVATDKAGNTRRASLTVRRSKARISGADYSGMYPTVQRGKGYTLVFTSKARPRYVFAAPAPHRPKGDGALFTKIGKHRWATSITFTEAEAHHRLWNLGIRVGRKLTVITVKVVK